MKNSRVALGISPPCPRNFPRGGLTQTYPVELIVFRFYDDQLFKMIVDDDGRDRTEGMTEADNKAVFKP
jgi:hypothetical protein